MKGRQNVGLEGLKKDAPRPSFGTVVLTFFVITDFRSTRFEVWQQSPKNYNVSSISTNPPKSLTVTI
jgi:hypothetical protein